MRYYSIEITDQAGLPVSINGKPVAFGSHDLHGNVFRGALNIEFDLPVVTADIPAGNGYLKIWGIDLSTLNLASTLNSKNITISAGMRAGLPLANEQVAASPMRSGILFQGTIFQAFGNWQGTEQSLDLIVTTHLSAAPQVAPVKNKPIVFSCPLGGSFQSSISQAMAAAGITSKISVSPLLTPAEPIIFQAGGINNFARSLMDQSQRIVNNPNYLGVKASKTVYGYQFSDNTTPGAPIGVFFNDLIGQPTWLDLLTVQMRLVLRSDITVMATVLMPPAISLNKSKVFGVVKNNIAFTGTGWVQSVRHIGNFRQQDANSWVTVVDSILDTKAGSL
jgi:hypothetical protein